jgi:TrmH family RNA methyltransferase
MPEVTSRQHAIVKEFRSVSRGDQTRLLLDGWHLVADAARAGVSLTRVAMHGRPPDEYQAIVDDLTRAGVTITAVSAPVLDAVSPVRAATGVVALAERPVVTLEALLEPAPALVIAGFGLQDPGNVGAIIRAAEAGGATGAIFDSASADPWGWKALRASMGSAFRLPVRRDREIRAALAQWRTAGLSLVAAHPRGAVDIQDADLSVPTVLLLGAEGTGLPEDVLDMASLRVAIPMKPPVESLNVAVAAALLVYEAAYQRD